MEVKGNQPYTFLQVKDSSVRRESDIDALATTDKNTAAVMVWHYHDDDTIAPAAPVEIRVKGILSKKVGVKHYRIDSEHSNSYEAWKKMGSPQQPTAAQIKTLGKAGKLQELAKSKKIQTLKGEAIIQFMLPRQVVSLVQLFW